MVNFLFSVMGQYVNSLQLVNIIEGVVFLLNIRENVLSNEIDGNFNSNEVLVLFFIEKLFFIIDDEEV